MKVTQIAMSKPVIRRGDVFRPRWRQAEELYFIGQQLNGPLCYVHWPTLEVSTMNLERFTDERFEKLPSGTTLTIEV